MPDTPVCGCISYNDPCPKQTVRPVAAVPYGRTRVASIDACIADALQQLWNARIVTTGSCCGHGGTEGPSVVVLHPEQVPRAAEALRDEGRTWQILTHVIKGGRDA